MRSASRASAGRVSTGGSTTSERRSLSPARAAGAPVLTRERVAVSVAGLTIPDVRGLSAAEPIGFGESLGLSVGGEPGARDLRNEIRARLRFMVDVGLDYLTLARSATSLS